jgi:hypothetical protein
MDSSNCFENCCTRNIVKFTQEQNIIIHKQFTPEVKGVNTFPWARAIFTSGNASTRNSNASSSPVRKTVVKTRVNTAIEAH